MTLLTRIAAFLAAAALSPAALAAESSMDKADVAWMLVSTTLVLFMTIPGIALFYGGMARKKNVLSILAQTTVICCALTLVWFIAGYSLAFGPGNAFVGGLSMAFLSGLDIKSMSGSIPSLLFVCFQMTFAILTAALMIGAFAGRHEVFRDARLHDPLVAVRLLAHLPLGLGRRGVLLRHGRA